MSLKDFGGQLLTESAKIARRIVREESTRLKWATVTSISPLRIRYDGETSSSAVTPQTTCAPAIGDRVSVAKYHRQAVIIGILGRRLRPVDSLDLAPYLTPGFTGSLVAYRDGRKIEMVGKLSGTFATGTTNFSTAIPAAWRPPGNRFAGAYLAGGYTGNAFIRADGTIAVAHQTGASRASAQFTISFTNIG